MNMLTRIGLCSTLTRCAIQGLKAINIKGSLSNGDIFFCFELLQQVPIELGFDFPPFLSINDVAQCEFVPVVGHDEIDRWLDCGLLQWKTIG